MISKAHNISGFDILSEKASHGLENLFVDEFEALIIAINIL